MEVASPLVARYGECFAKQLLGMSFTGGLDSVR